MIPKQPCRSFVFVMIWVCCVSQGNADTCIWSRREAGMSAGGRYSVVVSRRAWPNRPSWKYVWRDHDADETRSGQISQIDFHAHLMVFVSKDGQRFAIADLTAGHRSQDRILIYEPSGELIRSLGIADILVFAERDQVSSSVSHTSWVGYDKVRKSSIWIDDDGKSLQLVTKSDATARISLRDGAVSRQPWTVELQRYMLWLWLMAALLLAFAARFIGRYSRDCADRLQRRLSLDLCAAMVALLGILVWAVWRSQSNWRVFRVDDWSFMRSGVFAIIGTLLIVVFLGPGRWMTKLATLSIGVSAGALAVVLTYGTSLEPLAFTSLGLGVSLSLMSAVVARVGFTINPHISSEPNFAPRRQFGLQQLLFCIGFVAVCFAITNLQVSKQIANHQSVHRVLEGILVALFAIAVAWTTLTSTPGSLARCGFLLFVLTTAIMFAPQVFRYRGFDLKFWQSVLCCNSFLMLILLIFRAHGYRLTQRPQTRDLPEIS